MIKLILAFLLTAIVLVSGCVFSSPATVTCKCTDSATEVTVTCGESGKLFIYGKNQEYDFGKVEGCKETTKQLSTSDIDGGKVLSLLKIKPKADPYGYLPEYSPGQNPNVSTLPKPNIIAVPSPLKPSPDVKYEKFDCGSLIYKLTPGYALKTRNGGALAISGPDQTLDKKYPGFSYAGTCYMQVVVPPASDGGNDEGFISLVYFDKENELKTEMDKSFANDIRDYLKDGYGQGKHDGKGAYDDSVGGYSYFTDVSTKTTIFPVNYGYRVGMCLVFGKLTNHYSDSLAEMEKFKDSALSFVESVRNNQNLIDFCK